MARRARLGRKPVNASTRRYERLLVRRARKLRTLLLPLLLRMLREAEEVDHERADSDGVAALLGRLLGTLAVAQRVWEKNEPPVDEFVSVGGAVEAQASRQTARVVGLNLASIDVFAAQETLITEWAAVNIAKVKHTEGVVFDELRSVIVEGARGGTLTRTVAKSVAERLDVAESKARFLARNETGNLNAAITKQRQTELGVTKYRWSTSDDERVRDEHDDLDGRVFLWSEPPVTNANGDRNHPGEDYECRCVPIPILDDEDR